MHPPTATTSLCLLWWVLGQVLMTRTKGAAPPYTMLLLLTQMESEFHYEPLNVNSCRSKGLSFKKSKNKSPLMIDRCVEYLLRNDADPRVRDKQGYTAVHYAAAYGRTLCLELVGSVLY